MKYFRFFLFFLVLFTSCIKDNIKISDTGRKITINGLLTTDSLLNVRISRSTYLTDKSAASFDSLYSINDAKVVIYHNDDITDSLDYSFIHSYAASDFQDDMYNKGNYLSRNLIPVPGNKYKIVVNVPGLPMASSSIIIPNLVKIERVDTSRIIVPYPDPDNPTNIHLTCNIEFNDPGDETNYYLFSIFKIQNFYSFRDCHTLGFLCNDPIVEEKLTTGMGSSVGNDPLRGIVFSDKTINGQKYNFTVTIGGNDLGEPFRSDGSDPGDPYSHNKSVYFRLYSITEDYFKYLQTLNKYSKSYDNPLSDPVQVYSNVTGGNGIFAGAAVSSDSLVFTY
jgi:hypothetical protein